MRRDGMGCTDWGNDRSNDGEQQAETGAAQFAGN